MTVQSDGRYEEGMARMSVYHRHCQDPVIFRTLGDVRGKSLLDLACGDGFYTRRFRSECGADPVLGIDLSTKQIERARAIEQSEPLGIEYRVGDVTTLELDRRFDVATAIHLLHYLESEADIESALRRIVDLLSNGGGSNDDRQPGVRPRQARRIGIQDEIRLLLLTGGVRQWRPSALSSGRIREGTRADARASAVATCFHQRHRSRRWLHCGVARPLISTEGLETYGAGFFKATSPILKANSFG